MSHHHTPSALQLEFQFDILSVQKANCTCQICGKPFYTKPSRIAAGNGKYCSKSCFYQSKLRGVTRNCIQCGKSFYVPAGYIRKGGGKFCSKECQCAPPIDGRKDWPGRPPITRVQVRCEHCDKTFETYPSRVKAGVGRFCSVECHTQNQKNKQERFCQHCGKVFETTHGEIKRDGGKYCCKKCSNIGRRKRVDCACLQCGKSFQVHEYEVKRGGGRFCSYRCNYVYQGPTSIEAILCECLDELGIEYTPEYSIGRFNADAFVAPNFVFEADGDYWHSLPDVAKKDKRRDRIMRKKGYVVTRFSEDMLNHHRNQVILTIWRVLMC